MSARTALRTSVVMYWVFTIAAIACSSALEGLLPVELQEYLELEASLDTTAGELILAGVAILLVMGSLLASVGLLFRQRWAAHLFLGLTILGYLIFCYMGPTVEHAVAEVVDEVSVMLNGAILALAFFTDALERKTPAGEGVGLE